MDRSPLRIASDYNRGLCPEMRAVHVIIAFVRGVFAPLARLGAGTTASPDEPTRRQAWVMPLVLGGVGFLLVYPLDGSLSRLARSLPFSGDIKRELTAWQQYGALTSILVTAAIVALLDTNRWRRIFDLAAASILTVLACNLLKNVVGRPRPVLDDPHTFLGPWGMYPVPVSDPNFKGGVRRILSHAWGGAVDAGGATARRVSYELWSMPSSHTAGAVVLSFFLVAMYPKLRPIAIVLAVLVGLTRVITAAHWPTDVILGAALGYAISAVVIPNYMGIRALDWLWRRAIDPNAAPTALPLREAAA